MSKFFTENKLSVPILAVDVKRVFTEIDTNERDIFHDGSPLNEACF
ncbi:hypothetical protein Xets_03907 [Xenorhabdus sp. TS4]|nr:hypothetical protein [Xenorhabdus sp. TS4]